MGNAARKPLADSLRVLLRTRGIYMNRVTFSRFLDHINDIAPWFWPTGSLTLPSWEKLGGDLRCAQERGLLDPMVLPLWEMIRACLTDEQIPGLHTARQAFDKARSECSEESGATADCGSPEDLQGSNSDSDSEGSKEEVVFAKQDPPAQLKEEFRAREDKKGNQTPPCSSYSALREELKPFRPLASLRPTITPFRAPGPTAPPWPEEELLPGLPPPPMAARGRPQPMAPPWLKGELLPGLPSAPPSGEGGGRSFHQRVWSRLPFECSGLHAFPVQVGGRGGGGYYEPLEIKQLKAIKDAVSAYGPNAPFTMALLEALAGLLLTPGDWTQLARACLSPGQYLDWKSWNEEFCVEQAAANRENNQREWNRDMLLGRGAFEEDQTQYPRQVYEQISLQAWRRLAGKGEHTGHLTKIIQGQGEPFSDFVARMLEAANRIFPDAEAAHPLIKQLIFEQCTKECRDVLRTNKNRSLEEWTRLCHELGGLVTNHGLAAAMVAALQGAANGGKPPAKGNKSKNNTSCFGCGQTGHVKRNCPNRQIRQGGALGPERV
ncbi:endogenous retrovirus group K member 113 Gag polyprotein [Cavia porcellus]|uniref:endogenous retrovirus group K member 113 Gag polyprotein n=1 Tax=Cavia porcellus TaxID=10141 RepID=UPI002FE1B8C6